ncbi:MAG: His/Gly/Thr/Pro-type tRNA ligase C-terminal domain-containing protein, partial [Cellvibrionaceae bacterium]|nr:His/Gly/Thr/Pro-type tRNA ligase C-terminal domain-containing protein [Cellvibrionaceae bacterium]
NTAAGFAMGVERLVLLLEQLDAWPAELAPPADIYMVAASSEPVRAWAETAALAEQIRSALPELRVLSHCGGGSFKNQLKKANASGAAYALIMGDNELDQGQVLLKPLRGQGEQLLLAIDALIDALRALNTGE